jgi:hypothetical protein
MSCGGAAHFLTVRQRLSCWLARPLALLLLGFWGHVSALAAVEAVDCASMSMGRLDVMPASGSGMLRSVEMNAGDTLAFTFQADTRVTGAVTLVPADGRPQHLPYGPRATHVSYRAEQPGAVGIRIAAKGGKFATFVTTCNLARGSGPMAVDGLNLDMNSPLSWGATALQDSGRPMAAAPNTSPLHWLGGEPSGKEGPAGRYGVNLKLQPAVTIGVLAQFDQAGDPLLGPSALSDQPWLAGPVTSLQLGGGLSLDARAAWGSADPAAGHAADRQTVDARLTSKQQAGAWRFSPSIGFTHVQEKLGVAAEAPANVTGHQTVESGRVDLRPEMAYRVDMGQYMGQSMYIEPKFMIGTFWNLGDATTGAPHEGRHMAETGITVGATNGTKLQVGGAVQEGETRSENVWTGKIELNIPLK